MFFDKLFRYFHAIRLERLPTAHFCTLLEGTLTDFSPCQLGYSNHQRPFGYWPNCYAICCNVVTFNISLLISDRQPTGACISAVGPLMKLGIKGFLVRAFFETCSLHCLQQAAQCETLKRHHYGAAFVVERAPTVLYSGPRSPDFKFDLAVYILCGPKAASVPPCANHISHVSPQTGPLQKACSPRCLIVSLIFISHFVHNPPHVLTHGNIMIFFMAFICQMLHIFFWIQCFIKCIHLRHEA